MSDHSPHIARYHNGELDNVTSRNICKRAMQSKHGFYWLAKQNRSVSVDLPLHTGIGFHMPRDNINTDFFVLGYSIQYMKYSQSKLDFLCWMSQATCLAAFSPVLSYRDEDDSAVVTFEQSVVTTMDSLNSDFTACGGEGNLTARSCITDGNISPRYAEGNKSRYAESNVFRYGESNMSGKSEGNLTARSGYTEGNMSAQSGTSIQSLWNMGSDQDPHSPAEEVEVSEHLESDRRIHVQSTHIRRR
jgi:hypothetical protein